MCELLALSSRLPTSVTSSLAAFSQHRTSADGWGVAFHAGNDARLYKEPELAADSVWLDFIQHRHLTASLIVAHIRHATRGGRSLANTQPFSRELGGRIHVFAHNGRLDTIDADHAGEWSRYNPVGETDSEVAFCILLERISPLWSGGIPSLQARTTVFTNFAAELRALGPANILYADGDALFVHAHRRMQANGDIAPPGLWRLERHCVRDPDVAPPGGATPDLCRQDVVLFASVPLTNERWVPLAEGEVCAVRDGRLLRTTASPLAHRAIKVPAGAEASFTPDWTAPVV